MMPIMKTGHRISRSLALLAGCLLAPTGAGAQRQVSDVRVVVRDVRQERDSIRAVLEIRAEGLSVAPRERIYLFLAIRAGADERPMPPVVVCGRAQQRVVKRAERLSGVSEPVYAFLGAGRERLFRRTIPYSAAIPAEAWMKRARVVMVQERRDCRGRFHRYSVEVIADGIRFLERPVRTVVYDLPVSIPVPPREVVKRRSESGEAQIVYRVGNADIDPALGRNRHELDRIRASIEKVRRVQGVEINSVMVSSYASPEGSWQSNLALSERRAASLTGWLRRNYDLQGIRLASQGYGEDWEGLARLVGADSLLPEAEREAVLGIVADTEVFDGRERRLMQYAGGRTYRYLLANLFPKLRRSAYRIDFTVPEYTVETVREVYKTQPAMLSLYEFYLLASQYEPGSPAFRAVIEKATLVYPDEKVNRISMAMFSYLSGKLSEALEYLRGLEDEPDAWLYFSAFHARLNELDKAERYARRAADAGNPAAGEHLRRIAAYRADEDAYQERLAEWKKYGIDE